MRKPIRSENPNTDLIINAQLVKKMWVIDAKLIRPRPKSQLNTVRSRSWRLCFLVAPYDTLAHALPGIIIDLDRGVWKEKKWSRKRVKATLKRRQVKTKR